MQIRAAGKYRHADLALEDIVPTWGRRLKQLQTGKWSIGRLFWQSDIVSRENCIVGEAYGRSASYWDSCKECTDFSRRFPLYFKERMYDELHLDARRFVEHWNDKHGDIAVERSSPSWFDSLVRFDGYIRTYR